MSLNGSLGTGLQGVSQQQPRVRLRGQVTEQINMQSDVVRGLISRPPTKEIAVFTGESADLSFDDVEIDGVKYTVGFREGVLQVWDASGTAFTVNMEDQDATDYIGDNMSFHVYDKTIYATNRDKVVLASTVTDSAAVVTAIGLVQALGGQFGRDFTITINYSDDTARSYTQNIPDTDPDEVNGEHIMKMLIDGLNGTTTHTGSQSGTLKGTTTLVRDGAVLMITDSAVTFTLTLADGDDGDTLRGHVLTARTLEDLTRIAPHGTLVEVDGEKTADDDFYMRFEVETASPTVGSDFGKGGKWVEWVNALEPTDFDLKTMPHVLFLAAGEFFFERNLWLGRRAGDIDTNPEPSFVGEKITDIGGFQSRLTFTAGANWITSRTNFPADFWKKSVIAQLSSDPIDIASTTESEVSLKWMVPFDRDLLLMSEKHQFIVGGSGALTPNNASMVLTTDFEMAGNARPSSTGRTILFPYQVGKNAGVKEFFSSDELATNGANNITETVSTYIHGDIIQIATSTNFNMTLIRTDHAASSKTVWVYKYLWEGLDKKQSSWSKWVFPYDVAYVYWDNATVFVIMREGTEYFLTSLSMDYEPHNVGYIPLLDRQTDEVADSNSKVSLAFADAEFVQHTGCAVPGSQAQPIAVTGSGPFVYEFFANTVPSGATVVAGLIYEALVEPTMPFIRNRTGEVIENGTLVVTDFTIFFDNSGGIMSERRSKYRSDTRLFGNQKIITEGDPDDPLGIGIRDGEWNIPWGERTDWSGLTLKSIDQRPITILKIGWKGQGYKRGQEV